MAKNRKKNSEPYAAQTPSGASQRSDADKEYRPYDMAVSTRRLYENGLHPAVSFKQPAQLEQIWLRMAEGYLRRPSHREYVAGQIDRKSTFNPRRLTSALLLFKGKMNYELALMAADDDAKEPTNMLVKVLSSVDVGSIVVERIFMDGWKSVLSTAITSTRSWITLATSIKLWDFVAGDFRFDPQSGVLLAVMPDYTIGEIRAAHQFDPYGLDVSNHISGWAEQAMRHEREVYLSIYMVHGRVGPKEQRHKLWPKERRKYPLPEPFMASEITDVIKRIPYVENIWGSSQFLCNNATQLFDPPTIFAAMKLRCLLKQIFEQSAGIKVLYLQKIPMLDRRMVAIILRACPQVRMLGVYDCELVHFGDVLCMVDLIWEINTERRQKDLPQITAFDFYPAYSAGMPYKGDNAATYGLTWGPEKLEVVQRGFFLTIMKAFLKSKRMKLDLLFSKNKAFMDFLARVPNYPLAVPTFLDALYRYLELHPKAKDFERLRKEALYDLLKPVRLGLQRHMDYDWPVYFNTVLGRTSLFCCSCGYEAPEEFFTNFARDMLPQNRLCSGCTLQRWLDEERDHLRARRREALDCLFPDWNGKEFNKDAPLVVGSSGVLKLVSTQTVRTDPNPITVDSDGVMQVREQLASLIRDGKIHYDSLRNLPTLQKVTSGPDANYYWGKFYNICHNLDMYSRAARLAHDKKPTGWEGERRPSSRRTTCPETYFDEMQGARDPREGVQSHDFESALEFQGGLVTKGWAGL